MGRPPRYIDAFLAPPSRSSLTAVERVSDFDFTLTSLAGSELNENEPSNNGLLSPGHSHDDPLTPRTAVNGLSSPNSPDKSLDGSPNKEHTDLAPLRWTNPRMDPSLAAELVSAAEARHNRSVSSTSSQSAKSTNSSGSSVNQKLPKGRKFGPGLAYYELLSNIGKTFE